jgi:3D-(3,5/4)-trihydroxycyclohexane-1,2-dione acylhydrolase (decyclizing)
MKTIKLSCAHALFKFLIAQKTIIDGKKVPLFPGAFAIYGHGNVACLGQAMEEFSLIFQVIEVIMSKVWPYQE